MNGVRSPEPSVADWEVDAARLLVELLEDRNAPVDDRLRQMTAGIAPEDAASGINPSSDAEVVSAIDVGHAWKRRGLLGGLSSFLLWTATVDEAVLRRVPRPEAARYTALGAAMITSSVTVGLSATLAASSANISQVVAVLIGFAAALFTLSLERFSASTVSMPRRLRMASLGFLWTAIPRVLLALTIAVLMATPLVLRLFGPEIATQRLESSQEQQVELELTLLNSPQLHELQSRHAEARDDYQSALKRYNDEVAGQAGSGVPGYGELANVLKAEVDQAWLRLKDVEAQLSEAQDSVNRQIDEVNARARSTGGVIEQLDALTALSAKEPAVRITYLILIGLIGFAIALPSIWVIASAYREPTLYQILLDMEGRFSVARAELAYADATNPGQASIEVDAARNVDAKLERVKEESMAEVLSLVRRSR